MKTFKRLLTAAVTMTMMIGCFSAGSLLASVKDPNEPNDSPDKATKLKPGEIVLAEIGDPDLYKADYHFDEDWYKFEVVKGKTYRLYVTGFTQRLSKETMILIDGYYSLKDAKDATIYHDYIGFAMQKSKTDYYDIKATKTGTYYLQISNCVDTFSKLPTTSYTISINGGYKDVKKTSDFWYDPTYYLSSLGVVKGYDKGTKFKPNNDCTRAQMVTFLWRLKGSPAPKASSTEFKDIKKSDYYYKAVLWAVENGITTGMSKTKFGPSGVCTRAQTVTFLWRMAGKPSVGNAKNKFSDVKQGDYFYDAVIWASSQKIVAGYSDGTFKPSGKCARRQMVTFLYKYDKYINNKG
ncbi:MAG: S-layer homology domain-containing protein [Clostridiales bacterium]|nr:S-layer homology domain-containing protein [Clostridiales bacterium]